MRQRHPVGPARHGRRRKLAALPGSAVVLAALLAGGSSSAGAQGTRFRIDPGGIIEVTPPRADADEDPLVPPDDPDDPPVIDTDPLLPPDDPDDPPVIDTDPLLPPDEPDGPPVLDVDPPGDDPDEPPVIDPDPLLPPDEPDDPPVLDVDPPADDPAPPPPPVSEGAVTVTVAADAAAVPETGAEVQFTITVENGADVAVELDRLIDDRFGNLNGSGTCEIDVLIGPGEQYTCETTEQVTGSVGVDHVNTVTATAVLVEDQRRLTASGSTSISITDLTPAISLSYTASRDWVLAPSENVTFTVRIVNESAATDPVTIDSLVDSVQGNLNQVGTCIAPRTLAPGRQMTCIITVPVDQDDYSAQLTVSGLDDDGTPVDASAEVSVDLVAPAVSLEVSLDDDDADEAPGPFVAAATPVDLVYTITNDGDVPLADVRVTDNNSVTVSCPATELEPGENLRCTGTATAAAGANVHVGTVRANWTAPTKDKVWREATDSVHFFGALPSATIAIEPGLQAVPAGGEGQFTVTVTNTGNVALAEVSTLSGALSGCSQNLADLGPGETTTYDCTSSAVSEAFEAQLDLTATPPGGEPVTANATARVMLPLGRVVTQETACTDILSGSGDDLGTLSYTLGRSNRVLSVKPVLFTYFAILTVDEAGTVTIDQIDDASTPPLDTYQTSQTLLLSPDCARVQLGRSLKGSGTVTFTGVSPGTYVVSVKFTTDAVRGSLTPGVVTYRFTTSSGGEPIPSTEATVLLAPR